MREKIGMYTITALITVTVFAYVISVWSMDKANADEDVELENLREEVEILKEENWKLKDANWSLSDALQKQQAELGELKGE